MKYNKIEKIKTGDWTGEYDYAWKINELIDAYNELQGFKWNNHESLAENMHRWAVNQSEEKKECEHERSEDLIDRCYKCGVDLPKDQPSKPSIREVDLEDQIKEVIWKCMNKKSVSNEDADQIIELIKKIIENQKQTGSWEDYISKYGTWSPQERDGYNQATELMTEVKDFIKSEIQRAKEVERNKIVGLHYQMILPKHKVNHLENCIECKEIDAYNAGIIDFINLIKQP